MDTPLSRSRAAPAVARLRAVVEEEPRAWRRADLAARTSDHTVDAAVRAGIVRRAAPGLYVAAIHVDNPRALVDAASRWCAPTGAVGGWAALWILGLTPAAPQQVTIIAPHEFKRAPLAFTTVKRLTIGVPRHVANGMTVVSPVDAVIQAWEELPGDRRIGTTLDALRKGRLTTGQMRQRLADYPRVRGRAALLRVLNEFGDGATSFLEHRARTRVFNTVSFRGFSWQAPIVVRGRTYVADMFHREAGLVIELDGREFHGDTPSRLRDIERDANLATVGISTLRLTYDDILRRPAWCRETVLLALRARTGRSAPIEDAERGGSPRRKRPTAHGGGR